MGTGQLISDRPAKIYNRKVAGALRPLVLEPFPRNRVEHTVLREEKLAFHGSAELAKLYPGGMMPGGQRRVI
jgi:hypothetical protein